MALAGVAGVLVPNKPPKYKASTMITMTTTAPMIAYIVFLLFGGVASGVFGASIFPLFCAHSGPVAINVVPRIYIQTVRGE